MWILSSIHFYMPTITQHSEMLSCGFCVAGAQPKPYTPEQWAISTMVILKAHVQTTQNYLPSMGGYLFNWDTSLNHMIITGLYLFGETLYFTSAEASHHTRVYTMYTKCIVTSISVRCSVHQLCGNHCIFHQTWVMWLDPLF